MDYTHYITLSIAKQLSRMPLFEAVQGEAEGRKIVASIVDEDGVTAYTPGSGTTAVFMVKKPDGTGTEHSATISGSKVTVVLKEQDLACAGKAYCEILLKNGSTTLAAMPFYCTVHAEATGKDVESISEYQTIIKAAETANSASKTATAAAEQAQAVYEKVEGIVSGAEEATENAQTAADRANAIAESMEDSISSLSREKATAIVCDASGETITLTDSADTPIYSFSMYGKSTQDGEPTPDNPVPIESVENPTAIFSGKNLLPYPYYREGIYTSYGVTFTTYDDGSVLVNGTATSDIYFKLNKEDIPLKAGTEYKLTGCTKSDSSGYYRIYEDVNKKMQDMGNGVSYTPEQDFKARFYIHLAAGAIMKNVLLRPMLRLAPITDDTFEPYHTPQSATLTWTGRSVGDVADKLTVYADGSGKIERNIKKATFDSAVGYYSAETSNGIRVVVGQITDAIDVNITTDDTYKALSPTFRLGATGETKTAVCFTVGSQNVFINDGVSTSVAEYTAYLTANPLEIYYPVATPTTETLTAEQVQEILALNTYRPTTVIINDAGATMEVEYSVDTKTYIDRKFNELATAIANL